MFLESPSKKTMLEGFMSKKGRTYSDFEGLFNFNRRRIGIPFDMLQACTLIYVEKMPYYPPYNTDCIDHKDGSSIYLHVEDYSNATINITTSTNEKVELEYMYRTDNFPSIAVATTINKTRTVRYVKNLNLQSCAPACINSEIMEDIIEIVIPFLTSILYEAYKVNNEDD